jgi:hypothetical protein
VSGVPSRTTTYDVAPFDAVHDRRTAGVVLAVQKSAAESSGVEGTTPPHSPSGTVIVEVFDSVVPESFAARTLYPSGKSAGGFVSSKLKVDAGSDGESELPFRATTYDVAPDDALHETVTFATPPLHDDAVETLNDPGATPQMSVAMLMLMAFDSLAPPLFLARTVYVYEPPAATLKSFTAVAVVV